MDRISSLRRLGLLALALCALWPAAAAHAVGEGLGWSTPDYLSPDTATGMTPSLGTLADGAPVALWAQNDGSGYFPVIASKPIGGSWSSASPISADAIDAPATYSYGPRLAVTPQGQFVAAWLVHRTQLIGGNPASVPIVEGATGTVAAGSPPGFTHHVIADADAPHGHAFGFTPRVFLSPEGSGVIAYQYGDCCGGEFLGLTPLGGAQPLGTPGLPTASLPSYNQLGGSNTDDSGSVAAIALGPLSTTWTTSATDAAAAITISPSYRVGNTPPESALLSTTTDPSVWPATPQTLPLQGFGASVGVLSTGQPIVTAPSGDGRLLLWRGGSVTTIDPDVGPLQNEAAIATSWDGSATIAYQALDRNSGSIVIRAVTLSGVGSVSDPVTLSSTDANARIPVVAYAPDGTVHVAWGQNAVSGPGGVTGVDSSYKLPDGDFAATPTTVVHGLTDVGPVRLVVAADGFVTLVAQIKPGASWRVAAFTHANPAAPRNVTRPAIAANGPIGVGAQLSCSPGTWTASPTSYRFEWLLDGVALGPASEGVTHVVAPGEVGKAIVCRVTASNQAGSGQAESDPITPGGPGAGSGGAGGRPGTPKVRSVRANGDTVTVTLGCPAGASSCPPLTIQVLAPARAHASTAAAKRRAKPRAIVLASAKAHLRPGQTKKVTLKLNRTGRTLLARHGKLKVQVKVQAGRRVLATRSVTLKRKSARRR